MVRAIFFFRDSCHRGGAFFKNLLTENELDGCLLRLRHGVFAVVEEEVLPCFLRTILALIEELLCCCRFFHQDLPRDLRR